MKAGSQVSRAELLRALQECEGDTRQLAGLAALFGYEANTNSLNALTSLKLTPEHDKTGDSGKGSAKPETRLNPPPARAQVKYHYLAYYERYASEESAKKEQPEIFEAIEALSDDDLTGFWDAQEPLTRNSLVQPKRMTPLVRHSLRQAVGKRLDVKQLVKQVARQTPLKSIPMQARLLPAGRVTVIADLNQRLVPFWEDIDEACELIKQKHGKIGIDIRVLAKDEPQQDYYRYEDWQQRTLEPRPWEKIPAQSIVFIISDLGQLAPEKSLIRQRWLAFIRRLNRRGIKPLVLAPIAPEKQSAVFQSSTQLLLWQRFGRLTIQKAKGDLALHQQAVERVLGCLSLSPHIEPELLRAICELLPSHEGNTGIEAAVYLHPQVQFGLTSITLKAEQREHYRTLFAAQPEPLKQQVFDLIQRHHSEQFASVWAETVLNAETLMAVDKALLEKAESWMLSFAKRYYREPEHDGMMRFARRHLGRLASPKQDDQKAKDYASALYGLAHRQAIHSGEPIPEQYDTRITNQMLRELSEARHYQIRQVGNHCEISTATSESLGQVGQVFAEFTSVQKTIVINQQTLDLPVEHWPLSAELKIDTGQERFTLRSITKPTWASAMRMENGIPVATLILAAKPYELALKVSDAQPRRADWTVISGGPEVGFDEFGLYADVVFSGVTQRFRYIEPTTFMMGSPEDEKGRDNDEDYHQVTLTQGYWLADTACTQALWQAVMGENPANFKEDPQNPVEQVSWLDVQRFITSLKSHLPNLTIQLPSEAQWENACRAGTETPFNFKGDIDLAKVNYRGLWLTEKDEDGNYPWHDEAKQKTQTVKSYPANPWGLYEMHGNVLEWCFDEWKENLGQDSAVNPVNAIFKSGVKPDKAGSRAENANVYDSAVLENGDDDSVFRVLRGGSWLSNGRSCRSAFRNWNPADDRTGFVGFRFSLGLELQHSKVSRSDRIETAEISEQTEAATARSGAAQGLNQTESVTKGGFRGKDET